MTRLEEKNEETPITHFSVRIHEIYEKFSSFHRHAARFPVLARELLSKVVGDIVHFSGAIERPTSNRESKKEKR